MSNMQDVFNALALQLMTPPDELAKYANEDQLGGYHWDSRLRKWPMGSLFQEEGQVLYALIRKYKPMRIVEIGTLRGCSTAHMATALDVNGGGHITAIDIAANAGDLFPAHLKSYVTSVTGDGLAWLAGQEDESIDFLFEDSSHGEQMCASVAALCKDKLKPGGLFITHDAAHDFSIDGNGNKAYSPVGAEIRAGLTRALKDEYRVYLASPSDCGFALWRKPLESQSDTVRVMTAQGYKEVGTVTENGYEPMADELQALVDIHSKPVDIVANIREAHERLTEQANTIGLKPTELEVDFYGIPVQSGYVQMIDHEFKSQEHLPTEELPAVTEPPKKKRGRPSKKDKPE